MAKSLAVAVVHGMGRQKKDNPGNSAALSFSAKLHRRMREEMGKDQFDEKIAWREIFWADVLQPRQEDYERRMRRQSPFGPLRRFVMHKLSDAASYYPHLTPDGSTYQQVHERIDNVLHELEGDVEPGAPLLIMAHSLGGHMMSNYIYDMGKGRRPVPKGFRSLETFAGLFTFGCNIPVFVFACKKAVPIGFPGAKPERRLKPWWRNHYDAQDPLGYPLGPIGDGYEDMVKDREIEDVKVNVGFPIIQSWTFLSHNAYWNDRRFAKRAVRFAEDIMATA
ncbi:MAG: hypothetical protein HUJ27_08090 [Rhodobacteraceae bacterium]|nr:hypothetical protein [Paracoccaceae bacterium]